MDPAFFTPDTLALLFLAALVAGCLDTLAGGGGLITLPALILAGLPPLQALGTNKLQATSGTAMASYMMLRHRRVTVAQIAQPMLAALLGSAVASVLVQCFDTMFLEFLIPVVVAGIGLYFLCAGQVLETVKPARIGEQRFRWGICPAIGAYDGMFGPGTGSFFALAGVSLQGKPLVAATAQAKTLNFATNIASLLVFALAGQVAWAPGLVMIAGQLLGAWCGAHLLIRTSPLYLRILIVLICLALLLRYVSA